MEDISLERMNKNSYLNKIKSVFSGSFINNNNELILIPQTNLYFSLNDVNSELDLKCKLLEWCSRDCYKSQRYSQKWRNEKYHKDVLSKINYLLDTNFTEKEIAIIYTSLGNCAKHNLTVKFIQNGYNLDILRNDIEKPKEIEINGICEVPSYISLNEFNDMFLDFMDSYGWNFGGQIKEIK